MEQWNGINILDLAKDVVNENDVPIEERHVEFTVDRITFEVIKEVFQTDLDRLKNSLVWSKSLPKETIHDKILSLIISENLSRLTPVFLELSPIELESINIILRYHMDNLHNTDANDILIDTFVNLNFDYRAVGGIASPTFENFMGGR